MLFLPNIKQPNRRPEEFTTRVKIHSFFALFYRTCLNIGLQSTCLTNNSQIKKKKNNLNKLISLNNSGIGSIRLQKVTRDKYKVMLKSLNHINSAYDKSS